MPVTARPAAHPSKVVHSKLNPQPNPLRPYLSTVEVTPLEVSNPKELFQRSCLVQCATLRSNIDGYLQSSFKNTFSPSSPKRSKVIYSAPNGFFYACLKAYFDHHHLVIRPDDVWLAILTQLNLYIRGHAEEVGDQFLEQDLSMNLSFSIDGDTGNPKRPLIFADFAQQLTQKTQTYVRDPSLRDWVMPNFTTTTTTDKVVASVALMGTMSKYINYEGSTGCGIPSVTLMGERKDWEMMLLKLGMIPSLGKDPERWYELLIPVIKRFLRTFDQPDTLHTTGFWQRIVHHDEGGSGQPGVYTGWLNAFMFFNESGESLWSVDFQVVYNNWAERLRMDGVVYHRITTDDVALGWTALDIKVGDIYHDCGVHMATMIAGSVAMEFSSSGDHGEGADIVKPLAGWWVYENKDWEYFDMKECHPSEEGELLEPSPEGQLESEIFLSKVRARRARQQLWAHIEVQ